MLGGRHSCVIDGGVEDERGLGNDRGATGDDEARLVAGRGVDRYDQNDACDLGPLVADDLGVGRPGGGTCATR